jgi:hypothetical protein
MLTNKIGTTAGKVWRTLDQQGEMSISALKKAIGTKDSSVDWAIGWLAREDNVTFRMDKNVLKVGLKK